MTRRTRISPTSFSVSGARVARSDPEELVEGVQALGEDVQGVGSPGGRGVDVTVQAVDARFVAGREHLEAAAERAASAEERCVRVADSLAVEVLLYAAATRQISKAIDRLGVRGDTEAVGLVYRGASFEDLEPLGLERDDSVLRFTEAKRPRVEEAFGLGDLEVETVGEEKVPLLVRERVALSDLER